MTLSHIAADLRRSADAQPGSIFFHVLPIGLHIRIERRGDRLEMVALRHGVFPSPAEVKKVVAVFHVPAEIIAEDKKFADPRWHGYRWEWDEAPVIRQDPLFVENQ